MTTRSSYLPYPLAFVKITLNYDFEGVTNGSSRLHSCGIKEQESNSRSCDF